MYLRTTSRRNKDGSEVRYVQLAHNEWDPVRKCSFAKVVHSFGREDQLDRAALARLVRSLSRALEPEQALIATAPADLEFVSSVPMGGALVLDGLWRQLGIDRAIERLLADRRLDPRAERLLFAMVANRALAPFSKLACCEWLAADVAIPGLTADAVGEDPQPLYRAMDWLLEIEAELAEQIYWATADLLNLEVDLLFFDTTSTYWQTDQPDRDELDEDGGLRPAFRAYGHSKDHREDLPQVGVPTTSLRDPTPCVSRCALWPRRPTQPARVPAKPGVRTRHRAARTVTPVPGSSGMLPRLIAATNAAATNAPRCRARPHRPARRTIDSLHNGTIARAATRTARASWAPTASRRLTLTVVVRRLVVRTPVFRDAGQDRQLPARRVAARRRRARDAAAGLGAVSA
jgi:hypothetical protein